MINEEFWEKVSHEWIKEDDGIDVPEIEPIAPIIIDADTDDISDELADIFADLGLD